MGRYIKLEKRGRNEKTNHSEVVDLSKECENMGKQEMKLSRRNFLKATAAGVGGAYFFGNGMDTVDALTFDDNGNTVTKNTGTSEYWFQDSIGRKVKIPKKINEVIPTGHYAQTLLCTLCPEKLAAVADKPPVDEKPQYVESGIDQLYRLPETGKMYIAEGERDIKTDKIADMESNIIIDVGFVKDDLKLSLEYLQRNTETPVIFIDASFGKLPEAYRALGELLNREARAEELASYIENLYAEIKEKKTDLDTSPAILYAGNKNGVYKNIGYSVQNEVIKFLGGVPVLIPEGEQEYKIDEEVLERKSIDYIIFNDEASFNSILQREGEAYEIWSSVGAIDDSRYALSPGLYHSWFGFGLFAQVIGAAWLGRLVWQFVYNYDLLRIIKDFYKLFYDYSISESEIEVLLGKDK